VTGTAVRDPGPTRRFRTRGQPAALQAVDAMLDAGFPHAILLAGPAGVGKQTLATDIAAALLCRAEAGVPRPCRSCRGCRAVDHGNHPDLHRLEPTGAGLVIPIGGREERGVRDLVRELALLPVEGGARVAIIGDADRMTDDAQSAFLKTLEEPPAGTVLILTAADEERLLPTIRSRLVRIRVGPVARADVEALLVAGQLADPPMAARLARLAAGRPGDAVSLALAPEAVTIRAEIARTILDLARASRTDRLRLGRDLLGRAGAMAAAARPAVADGTGGASPARRASGRGRRAAGDGTEGATGTGGAATRIPAAERRAAALALVAIWRDVARDLALVGMGDASGIRQLELLDDLEAAAARLPAAFAPAQLRVLDVAGERLEGNVSPELVVDALALGWAA
jgi:DNA polymerase III delta' subunit